MLPKAPQLKRITKWLSAIAAVCLSSYFFKAPLVEGYFRLIPYIDPSYTENKNLVAPYFDEEFYKATYAQELQESKQAPLDHFMQRNGRFLGGYYNPTPWFYSKVYATRLWPCKGNPFVDFMKQPTQILSKDAPSVIIYSNEKQFFRALIAIEGFLRKNTHKVILTLHSQFEKSIPKCFEPHLKRGVEIKFTSDETVSFYKSPFLKDPAFYGVTTLKGVSEASTDLPITYYQLKPDYHFLMHRFYKYTKWFKTGILNPCMLNFAHYCFEPIEFSPFSTAEEGFKKDMRDLAPAFDQMFLNTALDDLENVITVPGYMISHVSLNEVSPNKTFELSYLLSLGGKGMDSFKTRGSFIYSYRKELWDKQTDFTLPTRFFISRRDKDKFSKDLNDRLLPTDSKKWIYESQFTLSIENTKQNDYFSEKLLDCFLTLCVPVYIGCPNITEYFDERGMIIATDPTAAVFLCNQLTPDDYQKMLPYLLKNKETALKLIALEKNKIEDFYQKNIKDVIS